MNLKPAMTTVWWLVRGLALVCVCAGSAPAQGALRSVTTKPPVLQNRAAIIKERDRLSEKLVGEHDTVTVRVFILVDDVGRIHQPEVKGPVKDQRLIKAAIALVTNMRFAPATENGRPLAVLLTVPVQFARPHPRKP